MPSSHLLKFLLKSLSNPDSKPGAGRLLRLSLVGALIGLLTAAAPPEGTWEYRFDMLLLGAHISEGFKLVATPTGLKLANFDGKVTQLNLVEQLPCGGDAEACLLLRDLRGVYYWMPYKHEDGGRLRVSLKGFSDPIASKSEAMAHKPELESEDGILLYSRAEFERLSKLPATQSLSPSEFKAIVAGIDALRASPRMQARIAKLKVTGDQPFAGMRIQNEMMQQVLAELGHAPFDKRTYQALLQAANR